LLGRLTLTGAGLGAPEGRVAAGFSGDFKSIGLFCRALVPALAAGLAAALAAGLPAFFVFIPDPRESQRLMLPATVIGLTAKGQRGGREPEVDRLSAKR
jgi:hypothetical protein